MHVASSQQPQPAGLEINYFINEVTTSPCLVTTRNAWHLSVERCLEPASNGGELQCKITNMAKMWVRQEFKTEKQRFEKPFTLEIERDLSIQRNGEGSQEFDKKSVLKLEQSYVALGTTVWDGSIALAKMFDNQEIFPSHYLQNCRVLELGAGCGLVGIYICLLGAKMTILTDQRCCVKTLENNVSSNVPEVYRNKIKVIEYCWGNNTVELAKDGLFDLVLAAEVLYSPTDSLLLAQSIPKLTYGDSRVFVSMGRNRGGEEVFVKTLVDRGYQCEEVPRNQLHPKYQDEVIKIIELKLKVS